MKTHILDCKSERGYATEDDVLPTGTPVVTCEALCPHCDEYAVGTFLGHLPGRELPKQIEHRCEVET